MLLVLVALIDRIPPNSITPESQIFLKIDDFITIVCWCNSEYIILMLRGIAHLIIHGTIAIDIVLLGMVSMTIETEHQPWHLMGIVIEHLRHIIVELLGIWRSMHTYHRSVEVERIGGALFFHKVEVRHRARIVVLDGIGVEAQKLHSACDKAEVWIAEHYLIGLVACAQTVVIAKQYNKRSFQLLQLLTSPLEFLCGTKVCHIAQMHHEVDAVALLIDVVHLFHEVVEPLVTVADDGEADGVLALHRLLYLLDICGIHILVAVHMHIVRVYIKYGVAARQAHEAQQNQRSLERNTSQAIRMHELNYITLFHVGKVTNSFLNNQGKTKKLSGVFLKVPTNENFRTSLTSTSDLRH